MITTISVLHDIPSAKIFNLGTDGYWDDDLCIVIETATVILSMMCFLSIFICFLPCSVLILINYNSVLFSHILLFPGQSCITSIELLF